MNRPAKLNASELHLQPVYVDQGSAGANAPKTTAIYGTPNIIVHLDALLGALPLAVPPGSARTAPLPDRTRMHGRVFIIGLD